MCGQDGDTDGFYCVESVTRDGVPVGEPDTSVDGLYEDPYIDLIGPGDIRFGVENWEVVGGVLQTGDPWGDVDPEATWEWTVNTGPIDPVELYGQMRDPELSFGGNDVTGHTFTLSLRAAPLALSWGVLGPDGCSYSGGCGDDMTVAGLVYNGFITGYVTDDAGSSLTPTEVNRRRGYINTYTSEYAAWYYDFDANAMVVELANVHLMAPGVPATGVFEQVIPDAMLIHDFGVPDPDTLTTGSVSVRQTGSTATVPFTVTREPGAIRIRIHDITFSTPQFRIRTKASVPGAPRWGSVTRPQKRMVKVTFRRPVADGGHAIKAYKVRCARGVSAWTVRLTKVKPALFPHMTLKPMTCTLRAINSEGAGPWSSPRTG